MKLKKAVHYAIYDETFTNWNSEVLDNWVYDDIKKDPRYAKKWISITSLAYHEPTNQVYLGIGSFSAELLWRFDPATKQIVSCGYEKVGEPYDAKFHRSLELDGDTLYAGIALFHDIDKQFVAKGGRLVKYDISSKEFTFLSRPCPPAYIQSIAMDRKRRILYGFGAVPEVFFRHDLDSGKSRVIAQIGNGAEFCEPHNPVLDADGNVWGTYGILRAFSYRTGPDSLRLFRYSPDDDKMTFFDHGLPRTEKPGDKSKPDTSILGPDGKLYIGTEAGALIRLDPATAEAKVLCCPNPESRRLPGLAFQPGTSILYGIGGEHYATKLFAYDIQKEELLFTQELVCTEDGMRPDRIHHMIFSNPNTIYAGENDNNDRSSFLWELTLEK